MDAHMKQLSMFFEAVTECRKTSERFKNEKIEALSRKSCEQQNEINRLHRLLMERKAESTFAKLSEGPNKKEARLDPEEEQFQTAGTWKRRLSSETDETETPVCRAEEKEKILSRIPKIQLGRKRPKTMSKDSDQLLKQKDKEITLLKSTNESLKSSFDRSQKDAEEVLSERKSRINKLEQENLKLRQTMDEKLSQTRFNDILSILESFKREFATKPQLPEAANKEDVEANTESMIENAEDEDETEAVQMAVRELQHSAEHRDKLEAENGKLVAKLREKEEEVIRQKEKLRELEEKLRACSECVEKQKEIEDLNCKLDRQEKIIMCKSQEINAKNDEIQEITIHANLTKSEVTNLHETVQMNATQIAAQRNDNDSLRKTVSQLEQKCNELELIQNSLKEKINQGDEANQRLCKYLDKLKKYVTERNEMYLKETTAIKDMVKERFNAGIFFKDGEIRIELL